MFIATTEYRRFIAGKACEHVSYYIPRIRLQACQAKLANGNYCSTENTQWRSQKGKFEGYGGSTRFPFLHLLPFFPSILFTPSPLPFRFPSSRNPLVEVGHLKSSWEVYGSDVNSSSRVQGGKKNQIWCIISSKYEIWWQQF